MKIRDGVKLADIVDVRSVIEGREFEDCDIVGPAVCAVLDGNTFDTNVFDGTFESLFLEVADGRSLQGVIGLKDVTFRRCRFVNVSFVGNHEMIALFGADFLG